MAERAVCGWVARHFRDASLRGRALAILGTLSSLAGCAEDAIPASEAPSPDAARAAPRLNLLLIAVDTLRADHLGAYGYPRPTSPEIDRLLDGAVVFEEAHSSSSWTLPSFATLLTSQHSSTHGCWTFESSLDDSFTTLAELLARSGYRTAGVVSHVFLGSEYGLHQGFERYDEALVHASLRDSHRAISSPELTRAAIAELERLETAEEPWFLFAHYFDPHKGYREHAGLADGMGAGDALARYDGEIAFTDAYIGDLLERLDELGAAQDTLVAFVADHGEEFEEHGGFEHGTTLYREVVHVPLALRMPGLSARRVRTPVAFVDFVPTVLELLGVDPPAVHLAGRSLVPLMQGQAADPQGILMELRFERIDASGRVEALVFGDWKLVLESAPTGEPIRALLFDRVGDPGDRMDVASMHPDVVGELTERLRRLVAEARSRAAAFGAPGVLTLDEAQLERLRQLGYLGDEADPGEDSSAARGNQRDAE